jgi:RNA polymerase sigma-70 factor (ECF subfamily)
MNSDIDHDLIEQCLDGDDQAFEKLLFKYQKIVFNLIYRLVQDYDDAEDLAQTVFLKVYQNLGSYNKKHRFYSWLYRIAVNESLNFIAYHRRKEELQDSFISTEETPDKVADNHDRNARIESILSELNPDYRLLIILRHYLDYSYQDMAEVLQLPLKKIKSRLYMARQILAEMMIKKGIDIYE